MSKLFDIFVMCDKNSRPKVEKLFDSFSKHNLSVWELSDWQYLTKLYDHIRSTYNDDKLRGLCHRLEINSAKWAGKDIAKEMLLELTAHRRRSELTMLLQADDPDFNLEFSLVLLHETAIQIDDASQIADEITSNTKALVAVADTDTGLPWEIESLAQVLRVLSTRRVIIVPVWVGTAAPDDRFVPDFLKSCPAVDLRFEETSDVDISELHLILSGMNQAAELGYALVTTAGKFAVATASDRHVDAVGVVEIKSRLNTLSEVLAQEANESASLAAQALPNDVFTKLVPLLVDLRWKRGYGIGLKRLLDVPPPKKFIRDFTCEEPSPPCEHMQGVLSANLDDSANVVINLDDQPALIITELEENEAQAICNSVHNYGRLGIGHDDGSSLQERIGKVPVHSSDEKQLMNTEEIRFYRNREVLIPLLARHKIPGASWLLGEKEQPSIVPLSDEQPPVGLPHPPEEEGEDEIFSSKEAFKISDVNNLLRQLKQRFRW